MSARAELPPQSPNEPFVAPPFPPQPPVPPLSTDPPPSELPSFIVGLDVTARFLQFNGSTGQPGAGQDGAVYGATQKLAFDVAPIVAVGARARLSFPDRKGWEQYGLRAAYEWVGSYSSGGSIRESTSLASELGVGGSVGQIIGGAAQAVGIGLSAERAQFTAGRVQVQVADTGVPVSETSLEFSRTRIEASFDLGQHLLPVKDIKAPVEQRSTVRILADYYALALPRIVYVTASANDGHDPNGNPINERSIVVAESSPQKAEARIYALGGMWRYVVVADRDIGHLAAEASALLGVGSIAFSLPARLGEPHGPNNQVPFETRNAAFIGRLGVDGAVHFLATRALELAIGGQVGTEVYYVRGEIGGPGAGIIGFQDFFSFGQAYLSGRFSSE